jgi:hypothetical protein
MLLHNKRKLAARRETQSPHSDRREVELPLATCYVGVGGYGTVEIRAMHDQGIHGKSVRLALPCRTDTPGEGECVLQPSDALVIYGTHGEIARIPVQRVIDHESYAGFRLVIDGSAVESSGENAGADAIDAFERYLAGVSARQLREKERREREID